MKKISGVRVSKLKASTKASPKVGGKQAKPSDSASKGTFGAAMRKVQKGAKPKPGKIKSF